MTHRRGFLLVGLVLTAVACGGDDNAAGDEAARPAAERAAAEPATALASGSEELTPEELEAGRMDASWRRYAEADTTGTSGARQESASRRSGDSSGSTAGSDGSPDTRGWDDISREAVNEPARGLPIHGDVEGPSVARVQILLDMNRFSPGVIDGRWGKNTEKAVYWFQKANGLDATGEVDQRTIEALEGGASGEVVTTRRLTEADVSGPFADLPEDVYERAAQDCLCYESRREQLAEVFHTTPEFLEQLNPGADLNSAAAGESLDVPAVEPFHVDALPDGKYTGGGPVARIRISDGGHYLHALDESGKILFHFPSTLGADYAPSPQGEFTVQSITFDPTWHYQPELLSKVDPSKDDAVLPAGPNNAVGVVWMALSKPHYGIHGTKAPETIGYATSHGCVRLTNWDAGFLGQRIPPGTPVEFTDVTRSE